MLKTIGIHHITAIVNDPQINYDFYSRILGLRLVKKTVNFDRPEVYHLYFGNESADPGTIITFFPWPKLQKGRVGTKQVGITSYAIPIGSSSFWKNRLENNQIQYSTSSRFNESIIQFQDPDGLIIELVERNEAVRNNWVTEEIETKHAIKGFAGATLYSLDPNGSAKVLEDLFSMTPIGQDEEFIRFKTEAPLGNTIDIKLSPTVRGLQGAGTVHHIAWRAKDETELLKWRDAVIQHGFQPTEVKDRSYFKAIYFAEPGGILYEIATDSPGFATDESLEELGTHLMLPSWYESRREEFEKILPALKEI